MFSLIANCMNCYTKTLLYIITLCEPEHCSLWQGEQLFIMRRQRPTEFDLMTVDLSSQADFIAFVAHRFYLFFDRVLQFLVKGVMSSIMTTFSS